MIIKFTTINSITKILIPVNLVAFLQLGSSPPSSGPLLPEIPCTSRHNDRFLDRDQRPKKIKPHPLTDGELSHCQRQLGLTGTTRDPRRPLSCGSHYSGATRLTLLHNDGLFLCPFTVKYSTSFSNKIHCRLRVGVEPFPNILFGRARFSS